jgi:microcystin degradation protein MlrC
MARIAVAGFQHETNTFAPQKATWDDFVRADAWPPLLRGPEMIQGVHGYNIPIAGAVKGLTALGHELVPLSWAAAPPCSYVEREAYERIAGMILEDLQKALPVDGIYLDLHGAMVADDHQDGEGELLARIRKLVGPDLPIVCSLDYHANLTPEMAQLSTALIGYRTYPNIDMADTGEKAAKLLDRLLREKRKLYKAYRQFNFLIPLVWQCTLNEPSKGLFDMIEEMEQGGSGKVTSKHNFNIVSATITPGFPPADITHCGPALVAYAWDQASADAAADALAAALNSRESQFDGEVFEPDAAVQKAMAMAATAKKPVVLADVQDNPGAGGTSDTVGLLKAMMRNKAKGAVIGMVVDPESAQAAHDAGEGNIMERGIGAVVGVGGETPAKARWRVTKLNSGNFTATGPFYGGAKMHLGQMALVTDEESGVSAVLAGRRVQAADQEMFRHVGVEPSKTPILGLKSTVHFRADFQPIAETILIVHSPGAHTTDPTEMPFTRLREGVRLRPNGTPFKRSAAAS